MEVKGLTVWQGHALHPAIPLFVFQSNPTRQVLQIGEAFVPVILIGGTLQPFTSKSGTIVAHDDLEDAFDVHIRDMQDEREGTPPTE